MGHLRATEAANAIADILGIEGALSYHLTTNHYPPVPTSMIPVCIEAINLAADIYTDEVEGAIVEVDLPDGITYRDRTSAPAQAIVEAHHLDAFVEAELERRNQDDPFEGLGATDFEKGIL